MNDGHLFANFAVGQKTEYGVKKPNSWDPTGIFSIESSSLVMTELTAAFITSVMT